MSLRLLSPVLKVIFLHLSFLQQYDELFFSIPYLVIVICHLWSDPPPSVIFCLLYAHSTPGSDSRRQVGKNLAKNPKAKLWEKVTHFVAILKNDALLLGFLNMTKNYAFLG